MSQNVEVVRKGIQAYNRRDLDAVLEDGAPDFEFDLSRAAGPVHGVLDADEFRSWVIDIWRIVNKGQLIAIVIAVLSLASFSGCASDDAAVYEERSSSASEECREHGGVAAFDDDVVICRDQTVNEERGDAAVEACRGHGGVVAFDDDIVICRDHTIWEAEER